MAIMLIPEKYIDELLQAVQNTTDADTIKKHRDYAINGIAEQYAKKIAENEKFAVKVLITAVHGMYAEKEMKNDLAKVKLLGLHDIPLTPEEKQKVLVTLLTAAHNYYDKALVEKVFEEVFGVKQVGLIINAWENVPPRIEI